MEPELEPPSFPPPEAAPVARPRSLLAIGTLMAGLCGALVPCLALVAFFMGVRALIELRKNPALRGRWMAVAGMIVPVVLPVWLAVAIPNVARFRARSRQAECRGTLGLLVQAEKRWFREHGSYSSDPGELDLDPRRGNRYSYFLADGPLQGRSKAEPSRPKAGMVGFEADTYQHPDQRPYTQRDLPLVLLGNATLGVTGACPRCSFTAACAGNVDKDATLDVWSVSSLSRAGPAGEAAAWEPFLEVDDVRQ